MSNIDHLLQGKYLTGVSSVVGDTRRQYEDRANLTELKTAAGLEFLVAIVADGVGSADNGGLAAQLSIDAVLSYMRESEETDIPLIIVNAIKYANYVVYKDVITRDVDASTTLVIGVFHKDRFYVGNVGDSRAYWIQESGKVIQLTLDHTHYNIKGGDPNSPQAEALVNAIGIQKNVYADIGMYLNTTDRKQASKIGTSGLPLKIGDTILLCSDGLIKDDLQGERFVAESEIVQSLQTETQPNAAAVKMTGLAEGRYVDDNVSVVTVQHTSPERIENVLTKQKRKSFVQKLIYSGLGLLILAGIIVGAFLLKANKAKQEALEELAKITPDTIIHTAVPLPTYTPAVAVSAGSIRANDMGSYDPVQGYQILGKKNYQGEDFPLWRLMDIEGKLSKIEFGDTNVKSGLLEIQTFEDLGVMFSIGSRDFGGESYSNNDLYVYGKSSLTVKNEVGVTQMSMNSGAIYLKLASQSERADIALPNHGEARVRIVGGTALLVVDPDKVTLWCLREECELDSGSNIRRLKEMHIQVFDYFEANLDDVETFDLQNNQDRYEEYLTWNNHCNSCLGFEKVPAPTPTATQVIKNNNLDPSETPVSKPKHTLTVNVVGEGTVLPISGSYDAGSTVTLTAKPETGWKFVGWSGDITSTDNPLDVTITKNMTITALFEKIQAQKYTLSVGKVGEGSVSFNPIGGSYDAGTEVKLTATPETGWKFVGWSGDAEGSTNTLTVKMTKNMSITATFEKIQAQKYTLSTKKVGDGFLTINPPGGSYDADTIVKVSATAADGWKFVGWSGDIDSSANPLSVTMSKDISITATFEKITSQKYSLTVKVDPPGGGSVSLDPVGGTYDAGTIVKVSATAETGWKFVGWSDGASGSANPLTVTMTKNMEITATFEQKPPQKYKLTVKIEPPQGGTVSLFPDGGTYDAGTSVTLTASAAEGWKFIGWVGALAGVDGKATVLMYGDKEVTANFESLSEKIGSFVPPIFPEPFNNGSFLLMK